MHSIIGGMNPGYNTPVERPTPHQNECGIILSEELTEIIQEALAVQHRVAKLLRFGVEEVQPGQSDTNKRRLGLEIGDLMETIRRAQLANLIDQQDIEDGKVRKSAQLDRFMQTTPSAD